MKINLGRTKKQLKRVLNIFWQNLFLVLILLAVADLVLGLVFFYFYYLKAQEEEPVTPLTLQVNQALLKSVFPRWDERELRYQQALSREFPNFFGEVMPQAPSSEATTSEETRTPPR